MSREEPLTGVITKWDATTSEREAIARLLGRPIRSGQSATISLEAIGEVLRSSGMATGGLAEAVIA